MKITDKFAYAILDGKVKYENCNFSVGRYNNGNLALSIEQEDGGETICTCSVNLPNRINEAYEIGVKDYSENVGMAKFLQRMGIIEDKPITCVHSGWVVVPFYRLTASGKELYKEMIDKEMCRK